MCTRLVSISQAHKLSNFDSPTSADEVREVWKGKRRELGTAQEGKRPLLSVEIRRLVQQLDLEKVLDVRDRALLLLGFAGAFRRSELVAIDVGDLKAREEGLVVHLHRSKTDQEDRGRKVGIPHGRHEETCPVRAVWKWLDCLEAGEGAEFRSLNRGGRIKDSRISGRTVARVVKRRVESIGLDPAPFTVPIIPSGPALRPQRRRQARPNVRL